MTDILALATAQWIEGASDDSLIAKHHEYTLALQSWNGRDNKAAGALLRKVNAEIEARGLTIDCVEDDNLAQDVE
jgi:hypothetical protein